MSENGSNSQENKILGAAVYEFGGYRLDVEQRLLTRDGEPIHLAPKTFDLLLFLVERRNRVVKKEEVFENVWGNSFVEDANLVVHVSALRRIFSNGADSGVSIETFPKTGYRLNAEVRELPSSAPGTGSQASVDVVPAVSAATETPKRYRLTWIWAGLAGLVVGAAASAWWFSLDAGSNVGNRKTGFNWDRQECLRDTETTNLVVGGCDDAVKSFALTSNPNGNWAYGYSPKDDPSKFILFEKANHNNHFGSPEVPVDWWSRPDEWFPFVLKNTSNVVFLTQNAIAVPPSMFEVHPGPEGERSVVRWIAPVNGFYRVQAQWRVLNAACYGSTDAMVIENGSTVRFSAEVEGYNLEKTFDSVFKCAAGQTVDFSVGYGSNGKYECDSTGFSAIVTTISLEGNAKEMGK